MIAVVLFLSAGVAFLLTRLIGRRWFWGYFLGGLSFGIYNELCFEFCWDYNTVLGPMVWRDVPLIIILGWGIFATMGLVLSNRVNKWLHIRNQWMHKLGDILFFSAVGFLFERIMPALHLWKYNFDLQSVVPIQIMGYMFVGLLVSCTGRRLQTLMDDKRAPEK